MAKGSTIGERIKAARSLAGLTQGRLGVEAGLDPISASIRINRYENGTHAPEFKTAQRLAEALKIPVAYLFCDDDELAEVIRAYGQLKKTDQRKLIEMAKQLLK